MRQDCEWMVKLEDRTRRSIRVSFPGGGKIVWMCRHSGDEKWRRYMTPTDEEWDFLENKVRCRYNRRRAGYQDVELVVALRQKHGAERKN